MPDFHYVGNTDEFKEGEMKGLEVAGEQVLVVKVGSRIYAIGNICTHRSCPLSEGFLEGLAVTCACHGFQFDVTTGEIVGPPLVPNETSYEVKLEEGKVFVRV